MYIEPEKVSPKFTTDVMSDRDSHRLEGSSRHWWNAIVSNGYSLNHQICWLATGYSIEERLSHLGVARHCDSLVTRNRFVQQRLRFFAITRGRAID
jgi:hypothetical protein